MTPVTESTKIDNPKMVFAGVDAGAKILVELSGGLAGSAAAAAAIDQRNTNVSTARRMTGFCPDRICTFLPSSATS
jgi:hypothetical protein